MTDSTSLAVSDSRVRRRDAGGNRYPPPGSGERSQELARRASKVLAGGVNSNFRLAAANRFYGSAAGSRLVDVDGREYIDYALGMGVAILGHSPRAVLDAVTLAQEQLQCPAGQQEAEVELGERIIDLVPSAELVRIGCTGSEMVQVAIRLARAMTGRSIIVKFEGHYHGWFDNIFAGTVVLDESSTAVPGPPPPQSAGQSLAALRDLVVLPWNDLALLERFLEDHGSEVAAVITEPICCNTSVIAPRDGYLEGLRSLCDKHRIVLVFDEVITGFRMSLGGAQARLGVTPDLTVLAKALGAGFPVAALGGRRSLMELFADGRVMHGGTYNANSMAVAAANAALAALSDPANHVYSRLEERSAQLAAGLEAAAKETDSHLVVQRVGPVLNTTFDAPGPVVDYRSYRASDLVTQRRFLALLEEEGVRVTSRGTWFLSSAHSEEDVESTVQAAARALARLPS